MEHLNRETMRALEAGEPGAVAHFREHLAHPCDVCEAFLASHPGPGLLDGAADALLLSLAPPREAPLDEVGFARIRRGLRAPAPARRWVGGLAAALAACLVAVVGVRTLVDRPDDGRPAWDGIKGAGHISVELSAAARAPDGTLRRLDPGARVGEGEVLALRYHATEAGVGLLMLQRAGAAPELLGEFPLRAGTHDLAGEGGLAGVSLGGESGPVSLWLVALSSREAERPEARQQAIKGVRNRDLERLSTARFDLQVEMGHNRR